MRPVRCIRALSAHWAARRAGVPLLGLSGALRALASVAVPLVRATPAGFGAAGARTGVLASAESQIHVLSSQSAGSRVTVAPGTDARAEDEEEDEEDDEEILPVDDGEVDEHDEEGDAVPVAIPKSAVLTHFARSSGAGGQNVNKVNTKAELRFVIDEAFWISDATRRRLRRLYPSNVTREGEFFVTSQRHRTQHQNVSDAWTKLQAMVDTAALPPKVRRLKVALSEHTKAKRTQDKRRRSSVKERRRSSGFDD